MQYFQRVVGIGNATYIEEIVGIDIVDAHYEETFPKGRKSKETSVGNIKNGHENVVGNFSKMVMKL